MKTNPETDQDTNPETASPLWHPRYWPIWAGVALVTLLNWLPFRLRNRLAAGLARLTFRPMAKQTRVARLNLELCFPEWSADDIEHLLKLNYQRYLQIIVQLPLLWWGRPEEIKRRVRFQGTEHLSVGADQGLGAIILYTHMMPLEFGAIALSAKYPFQGIYNPFKNAVIDYLFERARVRFGGHVSARGAGFRTLFSNLRKGMHMIYLCDEDFGHEGSVFAPFFHQPKATLAMLPRMVRHTGSHVLPAYTLYDPETNLFTAVIEPPIADYPDADPVASATKMNAAIEATIRACPEQYLWKLRLFRSMPDGGPSRYTDIRRG